MCALQCGFALALLVVGLPLAGVPIVSHAQWGEGPGKKYDIATTRQLHIGGAILQVEFAAGAMDLPVETLMQHVQAAAYGGFSTYYGRFPVPNGRGC